MAKDKLPERDPGASLMHGANVKDDTSRFTDRPLPTKGEGDDMIMVEGAQGADEIQVEK